MVFYKKINTVTVDNTHITGHIVFKFKSYMATNTTTGSTWQLKLMAWNVQQN